MGKDQPLAANLFVVDVASDTAESEQFRAKVVLVRWALIVTCAYLMLFSDGSSAARGLAPLLVAIFLASNLVVGRMPAASVAAQPFKIALALLDTSFITLSLYLAGQLLPELVVLCLGILILTIAGFRLGVIAAATLVMIAAYVGITWLVGSESIWRSSMLLRVPFLLGAALLYASLVEAGQPRASAHAAGQARAALLPAPGTQSLDDLAADLALQMEAVKRCQSAVWEGRHAAVSEALHDIAAGNQQMLSRITRQQAAAGGGAAVRSAA